VLRVPAALAARVDRPPESIAELDLERLLDVFGVSP